MQKDIKTYNILVVEDNSGDFFLVKEYLEEMILAPEIIQKHSFNQVSEYLISGYIPEVILLDLSLPDKNGEELISAILPLTKNIPIIILTGYTDANFAIKALALGISDYLLKDELNATTLYKSIVYTIERNKAIGRLKESEQRYSDLFHLSPLPMWVFNAKTLQFMDVNDSAIKHYGYTYEEFLSMTIDEIHPEGDIPDCEEIIKQIENESFSGGQFLHCKKNNTIIDVELQCNYLEFNNCNAVMVLANDITERLAHIKAIEKQNAKLRQIAWSQSHEVRAPLSRIMGILNLFQEDMITNEEKEEYLNYLANAADELDTIIKKIVDKTQGINITLNSES